MWGKDTLVTDRTGKCKITRGSLCILDNPSILLRRLQFFLFHSPSFLLKPEFSWFLLTWFWWAVCGRSVCCLLCSLRTEDWRGIRIWKHIQGRIHVFYIKLQRKVENAKYAFNTHHIFTQLHATRWIILHCCWELKGKWKWFDINMHVTNHVLFLFFNCHHNAGNTVFESETFHGWTT